VNSHYDHR